MLDVECRLADTLNVRFFLLVESGEGSKVRIGAHFEACGVIMDGGCWMLDVG